MANGGRACLEVADEQQRQDELGRIEPVFPELAFPALRGLYTLGAAAIPATSILAGDTALVDKHMDTGEVGHLSSAAGQAI